MRPLAVTTGLVAVALTLSACAPSPQAGSGVSVVASTNVWGSVARAIGGDLVTVTSIIDSAAKDPHEYAATARDQLELSRASLVIANGGGYDDFITTMLSASGNREALLLDAVTASGHSGDTNLNEHVWYDLAGVKAVAAGIEGDLARILPAKAASFAANRARFDGSMDALIATEANLRAGHGGEGVAITEPLPDYLLTAIGLVVRTPIAFSQAIENGTDAPPEVLRAALAVFSSGSVSLLVYNEQTAGVETTASLDAATANGIPIVAVGEILPPDTDYTDWMAGILARVASALET